jgi:hypothetical protein
VPRRNSKVRIYFRKVDAASRRKRESAQRAATPTAQPRVVERTAESLWYDKKPEGWNYLDWHRAWNGGYPTEEHVELYNSLHPIEEQITLEEEEDDA